jgi:hypothetical protein
MLAQKAVGLLSVREMEDERVHMQESYKRKPKPKGLGILVKTHKERLKAD